MKSSKIAISHYFLGLLILTLSIFSLPLNAQKPDLANVKVTRLLDRTLIGPDIHPSVGINIQGPSMIKVPEWAPNRLGNYYLYFADHKGLYIRLAYADSIAGPWQIYEPGSMKIEDSFFAATRPPIAEERLAELVASRKASGVKVSHDLALELTEPHIASPDVHVDEESRHIIMYFHGLEAAAQQHSRVATSPDGINFTTLPENIGRTYVRAFKHAGMTYTIAMPGQFYRSANGLTDFETGPLLFESTMRHSAVIIRGNYLYVFWTRVGDAPETIMLSTIELTDDWNDWQESPEVEVLRAEYDWEGADAPIEPSVRSTAYGQVNQLRDPSLYVEDGVVYLLYAVAGESGIALARVDF
jgi:hypothetical protein|tara:strand:+ start:3087 stop:4157 length:1071 start_codon:yes stop_codon:yes gene_type:complete